MGDYSNFHHYETIAEKLKVIAHPARLQILNMLIERGAQNVTQLYEELEMPQSTISQHLGKLRSVGVVYGNRRGLEIYYYIAEENIRYILQIVNQSQQPVHR